MIIKKKKVVPEKAFGDSEPKESSSETVQEKSIKEDDFGKDEFADINFTQRDERRRGNRRRGYRRIEDRKLVSRAQEEAVSIRETAAKEGFQKGIEMAEAELANIKNSLCEISNIRQKVYGEISEDILDIAVAVAEKIIKKEVETDKSVIISMIKAALGDCAKHETNITIKVSEENFENVKNSIPEIASSLSGNVKINVVPMNDLDENGVIIETGNGLMDISCETQLEVIREMFKTI